MKIASIIFVCLGIISNFVGSLFSFFIFDLGNNIEFLPFALWSVIGVIVGVLAIISLIQDKKSTAIGVLTIIFTSLIGGTMYLCWKPNEVKK